MPKINLSPQLFRIQPSEVAPVKERITEKSAFVKNITAVRNSVARLSVGLPNFFNPFRQTEATEAPFHRREASEGRAVLTRKIVKEHMLQKLNELDIKSHASKDPSYARQTCEAILSAQYSNNKDKYCRLLINQGVSITPFLKEIGEAAQNAGLPGEIKNGVFTPGGAGANPFITPLVSSASIKYPYIFTNHNQQTSFKAYAEKLIMKEVTPLFKEQNLPTPQQFHLTLENIASKYIQNTR
ncbi:type III secretion system guanine nucleotide exchange factor SopE2 [Salmonella bongori serovar 48:i:- str. 94-0708]|uniref:type III secretion system guanine nucleotide exchange factor SopE2 n=1 Tax=Salmonella bongori TaxID=54736 RepID=UPI0009AA75CB|nr:type III secretion system guanine nucleotide exchange factor SopE2 [Salmonella bongori]EGE4657849.1 type III secretion system guanine nucleotide exchange factor SopE2 [Salmonella bongori serovar 48:i:- str. 94-0708]